MQHYIALHIYSGRHLALHLFGTTPVPRFLPSQDKSTAIRIILLLLESS